MWSNRSEACRDLVFSKVLLRTFDKCWDLQLPEADACKPFDVK